LSSIRIASAADIVELHIQRLAVIMECRQSFVKAALFGGVGSGTLLVMNLLAEKRILLGVCGGIAAYKGAELVR